MNQINWLDVYNSSTIFGILAVIAVGIWILVIKKDLKSKKPTRKK